jgi:hypothetical protein
MRATTKGISAVRASVGFQFASLRGCWLLEHALAVAVAQHGLEDEADAHGQARDRKAGLLERGQRIELFAALKSLEGIERIREGHGKG